MLLNDKLKARRIELGLTMLEVAKTVGVSEATISRWESGDIGNMRRDKIALYAKALKTSPLFIMGIDKDNFENEEKSEKKQIIISSHELNVIESYRNKPDLQPVVDKILDVEKVDSVYLYSAARSSDGKKDGIIELTKEQYDRLTTTEETDEDL